MKQIYIEIETDNDAFQDGMMGNELARIFAKLSLWALKEDFFPHHILDLNGNIVGQVKIGDGIKFE